MTLKAEGHECLISLHYEFCSTISDAISNANDFCALQHHYYLIFEIWKNREMRSVVLTVLNLNATLLMSVALAVLNLIATLLTNSLEITSLRESCLATNNIFLQNWSTVCVFIMVTIERNFWGPNESEHSQTIRKRLGDVFQFLYFDPLFEKISLLQGNRVMEWLKFPQNAKYRNLWVFFCF